MKLKGNVVSMPIAIISLVILAAVGTYLALYIRNSNQEIAEIEAEAVTPSTSTDLNLNKPNATESTINTTEPTDTNTTEEPKTTDETTDWQTYTNDEYGFSFKYPKDWDINQNAISNRELLVSFLIKDSGIAGNSFNVYHSTKEISIVPNTTIDGKKANKGNRVQGIESQSQAVTILLDNGSYFEIVAEGSGLENFDQILATFKFTD